ncbi:M16 family metallopeptidase [uncultured Ferrimonas sp.]|uniref:M16 family metallopeptidase n=1 Tax=uncultured Ferrimonas sp. TaxID=432640 RepID=UPI00261C2304|nr:M16 family metallopeptidase [uncultured Ferrimonas sp.]
MKKLPLALVVSSLLIGGCHLTTDPADRTVASGADSNTAVVAATPLPLRTDLTQGTLANGMRYLILPNQQPEQRVSMQLIVHAGSLDEADDQRGIAHLVEHMAFNGTKKYPANGIIERQEAMGMVFGRDVNAMTEYATTSYYLHLPDNQAATVDEAFTMLSQQAVAVVFEQAELEKERPVVEEEWRRGRNMMARLSAASRILMLEGSRFGERDPIGDMDLVRNIGADRIEAFYDDWYHPNNMTMVVVGDITPAQIEAQLNKHFAPLPAKPLPARPDLTVPLPKPMKLAAITDPEITTEVISINFRGESPLPVSHGQLRDELLNSLTFSMLDTRLAAQYETETDNVSRVMASAMPIATGYNNDRLMAIMKTENYRDILQELFGEASRYAKHGFSQRDLTVAKKEIARRYRQMADSLKAGKNRHRMMALFNQIRMGKPLVAMTDLNQAVNQQLDNITLADINAHFNQVLSQRGPMVVAQINSANQAKLPSEAEVAQLWQQALANPPAAIVQQAVPASLFATVPAKAAVADHQINGDVHKWTLANGAQIWFHPSDDSANSLQLRWQSYGGTESLPAELRRAASMATRNLGQFGYGGFDRDVLNALNADANIIIAPFVDQNRHGVFGSTDAEALEVWLQNLNLMLTAPQTNAAIWQAKQDFMARSIERRQDNPNTKFNRAVDSIRYANNPSLLPLQADEVRGIQIEQIAAAYDRLFGSAQGHQLVVVGNASPDKVIDLAARYLGHLPAGEVGKALPLPKLVQGEHKVRVVGGEEPQGVTSVLFNADYAYSREAEYRAYLLTRIISVRMREKLREEAGGVYTTSFGIKLDRHRDQAFGMVSYSHQPERADELKQMALAIMADVASNGVTDAELDTVKAQLLTGLKPEAISDRDRYRWLTEQARDNQFRDLPGSYIAWLEQVRAAELQPMASTILASGNQIDALLLPAPKA